MADDGDEVARFGRLFGEFLERVVHGAPGSGSNRLARRLRAHLGEDPQSLPLAAATWPPYEHVNVHRGVLAALGGAAAELIGVGTRFHHVEGLASLVEGAVRHGAVDVGPVERTSLPVGPDDTEDVVARGLWLAEVSGARMALMLSAADPSQGQDRVSVEVLCADAGAARALLTRVRREAVERSVFRGQVLSFDASDFGPAMGPIRFHHRAGLGRDDLVLPDGVLEVIERQVVGIARHRERLLATGQHLKRGVLLHGPPGTGKTHTVRYLVSRLPDATVVLLAGQSLHLIGEACALARLLQPALVVLEDCELVAEDRDLSAGPQPLLFDVLNELDGMAGDADVVFLLTTNRADLLETALAERPGRVDQAVEIPRPDADCRHRLLALYTRAVPLAGDVDPQIPVDATEGTTASFMKELVRRAVLVAAGEHVAGPPGPVTVAARHLDAALAELASGRDGLTRTVLGGTGRDGPRRGLVRGVKYGGDAYGSDVSYDDTYGGGRFGGEDDSRGGGSDDSGSDGSGSAYDVRD